MDRYLVQGKFGLDAEVLYNRNRDMIFVLSWLTENEFSMDPQDKCQRNMNIGQVMSYSVSWIPLVQVMEETPLVVNRILLIIDIVEGCFQCTKWISTTQAAQLAKYKF